MTSHDNAVRDIRGGPIVVHGQNVMRATGYSLFELERAGLTARDATRLGIPVDRTRLTIIGCNVIQLCALAPESWVTR